MADTDLNPGAGPVKARTLERTVNVKTQVVQLEFGGDEENPEQLVSSSNPLPVAGPLTNAQLRAEAVPVSATFWQETQPVSGPLTDAELRATPVAMAAAGAEYWPGYSGSPDTSEQPLHVDPSGALITRGAVTTDEGTFRVNFANTSLAVAIGTVTIAGDTVTGTGFLAADVHYKDYFKLDADGESAWMGIASVDSDTKMTLRVPYVGGSSGAASRALVRPVTGSGGAISVASGQATMTTGTTVNAITRLVRDMDFAPLVGRARVSVSQRIANQSFRIGLTEAFTTSDRWFARFLVDGTTSNTVKCESARNPTTTPSAAETETTTITLPGGITTASNPEYRIEQLTESVRFYVNGVVVAEHTRCIPAQHDEMEFAVTCINGASAPASSTTVVVDYMTGKNHNKLEIGVMSDAEKIVAAAVPLQQFNYGPVAGVIAINTDLMVLDCSQLRSLFIQCNSMGTTGVATVAWSNTPDFAQPITATLMSESGATSTTFNAAVLRVTNVLARYCRIRLTTATTAGTTTLNVWGAQTTYTPIVATQPVSGTVGVTGDTAAAAAADGLANPTIKQIGADNMLFNGTTWDRQRNNLSVAVDTSSARVANGTGVTFTNHNGRSVAFWLNVTAISGTTPTMTGRLQWSPDNGTTWLDMDTTNLQTVSITGTGNFLLSVGPNLPVVANRSANQMAPRLMRLAWTIGGTTPSFTFTSWANTSA